MNRIRILAVGRLKTPHWQAAAAHYMKRLSREFSVSEHLIKDANPALPEAARKSREGEALLALLRPSDILICLDEHGKSLSSREFAVFLRTQIDTGNSACFALGGAFGLDAPVLAKARHILSFGPMTLPHELARVVLLEQLYRAQSILAGTGYHH